MRLLMVIVKRIEAVEIPDSAPYKEAVEIYKMEYEKAAQRYNDLYNAAWTNFSYMALVAGGLLTFGGARFVTPLTGFLACLPLLFWWVATFEPLNRYGDKVENELGDVERALNALCISDDFPKDARKGLTHFQHFATREHDRSAKKIIVKHVIAVLLFLPSLLFAMSKFLDKDKPPLLAIGLVVAVVFISSIAFQLIGISKERRNSLWSRPQKELKSALRESRRVRNRVRIAALVLLITAICFGFRVWRLQSDGKTLIVQPSKASESPPAG
jgi:hypothetical protein